MARLDAERRRRFPPERNHLRAHLTLFHALPGEHFEDVFAAVRAAAPSAPLPATVDRLLKLGRGVAYHVHCPPLLAVRAAIAGAGLALTAQDRQPWRRPHVTVQNKVTPAEADALFDTLSERFAPWPTAVVALRLWHYRGGPWSHAADVPLTGEV